MPESDRSRDNCSHAGLRYLGAEYRVAGESDLIVMAKTQVTSVRLDRLFTDSPACYPGNIKGSRALGFHLGRKVSNREN